MKTRILSAIVLIIIVAAVLTGGAFYPMIVTAFLALLNLIACYEMVHNAAGVKSAAALCGMAVYSVLAVFALDGYMIAGKVSISVLSIFYGIFAACMTLFNHKSFKLQSIAALMGMPLILSFAFSSLLSTLNNKNGIYYLLLLLNFSAICDMGAYFVGVTIGKHKLCPGISPKKTVEGAIGGILASVIVSVILVLSFGFSDKLPLTLALTVPFCILGMIGDLFASSIKRAVGIKDYGNLIPGHGGILDRLDSILMISPLLYLLISAGTL